MLYHGKVSGVPTGFTVNRTQELGVKRFRGSTDSNAGETVESILFFDLLNVNRRLTIVVSMFQHGESPWPIPVPPFPAMYQPPHAYLARLRMLLLRHPGS